MTAYQLLIYRHWDPHWRGLTRYFKCQCVLNAFLVSLLAH